MAQVLDQEIVRQETTTAEPSPTQAPTSTTSVATNRISRTSVTSVHVGDYNDRAIQVVWWIVGFVDVLLAIRFLLKLLGGSTVSGFVTFMYNITQPLVAPFHGIFNTTVQGRSILEPESLVAIAIYSLIGWGIVSLIHMMTRTRRAEAV
jgi:YGGT family